MKYYLVFLLVLLTAHSREQVNWSRFLSVLAVVESAAGTDLENEAEGGHGWYSMRRLARIDANDYMKTNFTGRDLHNRVVANRMFFAYIRRYQSKWSTMYDLIHLWHLGPSWRKRLDKDNGYHRRVSALYYNK